MVGAEAAWLPRVWPQLQCNACKQATSAALVSFPRSRAGTHRRRATTGSRLSQLTGSALSALPYLTRFETNADAYDIFFLKKNESLHRLSLSCGGSSDPCDIVCDAFQFVQYNGMRTGGQLAQLDCVVRDSPFRPWAWP